MRTLRTLRVHRSRCFMAKRQEHRHDTITSATVGSATHSTSRRRVYPPMPSCQRRLAPLIHPSRNRSRINVPLSVSSAHLPHRLGATCHLSPRAPDAPPLLPRDRRAPSVRSVYHTAAAEGPARWGASRYRPPRDEWRIRLRVGRGDGDQHRRHATVGPTPYLTQYAGALLDERG